MSDFHVNGDDHEALAREKSLAILAAMTKETHDDDWLRKVMLPTIGKFVSAQIKLATAPLIARIEELEARKYCGVHQRALAYKRGSQVTHGGNLWACVEDAQPNESPGQSSKWQLAAKVSDRRLPTSGRASPQPEQRSGR